jgi:hypothetical protein
MGVSSQVQNGVNGILVEPGKSKEEMAQADAILGKATVQLLRDPAQRKRLGETASRIARGRNSPRAVQQRVADAFVSALDHAQMAGLHPTMLKSKPAQLWQSFQNARPWAMAHSALLLFGLMRPFGHGSKAANHPLIWK